MMDVSKVTSGWQEGVTVISTPKTASSSGFISGRSLPGWCWRPVGPSFLLFFTHTANMDTCWCPAQEQGNLFRILLQIRPRHNQKSKDWNTSVLTSKSTKSNCVKHVKRHVCSRFIVLDVISCQKNPADWETSGIYSWGPWWPLRPAHLEVEFQSTPR